MIVNTSSEIQTSTGYVITDNKSGEVIFRFDTIEEFNFSATATVTSYPTEKGINVNDYKYLNADNFSARGLISRRSSNANQIELIQSQLKYYQSGMYGLNIQTKSGLYERYTLADYEIVENADNYGLFEVDMNFKQMLNVDGAQYNRTSYDNDTVDAGISYVQEIPTESTEYNYIKTGIYFDPSLIAGIIQAAEVSGDGTGTIDTDESGGGSSGGSSGESGDSDEPINFDELFNSLKDDESTGLYDYDTKARYTVPEGKTITNYEITSHSALNGPSITQAFVSLKITYDDGTTKSNISDGLKPAAKIQKFPWESEQNYMNSDTSKTAEIHLIDSKIKAAGHWSWVEETYEVTSLVTMYDKSVMTNRMTFTYANDITYSIGGVSESFGHYEQVAVQRGGSTTLSSEDNTYRIYRYMDNVEITDYPDGDTSKRSRYSSNNEMYGTIKVRKR